MILQILVDSAILQILVDSAKLKASHLMDRLTIGLGELYHEAYPKSAGGSEPTSGSRIVPDPKPPEPKVDCDPEIIFISAPIGGQIPGPAKGQRWRTKDRRRSSAVVIVAVHEDDCYVLTDNDRTIRVERLLKFYTYEGFYLNYQVFGVD